MAATTSYHFDVLLFHHNMPQAADTNSGRGEAQWGWWLCWTCDTRIRGSHRRVRTHLTYCLGCSSVGLCWSGSQLSMAKELGNPARSILMLMIFVQGEWCARVLLKNYRQSRVSESTVQKAREASILVASLWIYYTKLLLKIISWLSLRIYFYYSV